MSDRTLDQIAAHRSIDALTLGKFLGIAACVEDGLPSEQLLKSMVRIKNEYYKELGEIENGREAITDCKTS